MFKIGDRVRVKATGEKGKITFVDGYTEIGAVYEVEMLQGNTHFVERDLELVDEYTDVIKIKDSGNRREFFTGAVRDMAEGKGRCDLMPLDVVGDILGDNIIESIGEFQKSNEIEHLLDAILYFINEELMQDRYNVILNLAKHFEQGALKYGENNWRKGLNTSCYIDSAVRHYLKFMRGDKDEPHDRAFIWNLVCCIWTCENKPELNDYRKDEGDGKNN